MPLFLLANWKWIAAALGGVALMALGAYGASLHYRSIISDMEKEQSQAVTEGYKATIAQFTADADKVHEAATQYTAFQTNLDSRFASISKDFRNAVKAKPLPVDCVPDAGRLLSLTAAVAAANSATGRQPVPAVSPAQ